MLDLHPQDFVAELKRQSIRRFYFVYDRESGQVRPSHPHLEAIAEFLGNDRRDFLEHEGLFFELHEDLDTLLGAFVHRTVRGAGAGGVRFWSYDRLGDYLRDGLRLSKGMTRKNALAGIWWGGGKGVIAANPALDKRDHKIRAEIFRAYGRLMSSLKGCYVTAEDAGTNIQDMDHIFETTRFLTCISPELGGSGNPSSPTARGVICGMEGALEFLDMGTLRGKTVAIQGVGNVGGPLVDFLLEKGVAKVIACDVEPASVELIRNQHVFDDLEISLVQPGDNTILETECDLLAPCATGATLNAETIPRIRAKIVCGAANNQLEDSARDDQLLREHGVVYVPDFVTNRMGIVHCSNEQYGYVNDDPAIEKHLSRDWEFSVYRTSLRVLKEAADKGEPTAAVAIRQADALAAIEHPIWGHRGQQIIDSLVASRWQDG